MHPVVRSALERLGTAFILPFLGRRRAARSTVLAYHNVVPDEWHVRGDRSLHIRQSEFQDQLDMLCSTHRVVSLRDLLNEIPGNVDEPSAAITFDDAYRGALELALPELERRGLPATVFVAPATLGRPSFWWDAVAGREGEPLDDSTREHFLRELQGAEAPILEWSKRKGRSLQEPGEWERPGTEAELRTAALGPLVKIGSHGWSHGNLAAQPLVQVREELAESLAWLRARFPDRFVSLLAYPYGLTSPAVMAATKEAGYEAAFVILGGDFSRADLSRYALPRLNVPAGISVRGLRLRTAGLLA